MRNRLIVHFDKDGKKVLGAYSSAQEASEATGINIGYIGRNLNGTLNDCPDGTKFRYEVLASDFRRKKNGR